MKNFDIGEMLEAILADETTEKIAQRNELPSNMESDFKITGIVTCRGRDYILINTAEFGIMRVEIEDNAFNPFERLKAKDKVQCKGTLTQGNFVKILKSSTVTKEQ